jgi:hypothetical protein
MVDSRFWCLRGPESSKRLARGAKGKNKSEKIVCPIDDDHQRGGKRITNLSVVLPQGAVEDFVWTWLSDCLIQDSVLDLFKKRGFRGFEVKTVEAEFKRPDVEPPRLWEVVVTGWAGTASANSGVKLVERCDWCGDLEYSGCDDPARLIDLSQWDGSDLFMVWPLPKFIFVTDRVAQLIREHRLTGVALRTPTDLDLSGGFGPGRLSYWMPAERAHELGDELGIF